MNKILTIVFLSLGLIFSIQNSIAQDSRNYPLDENFTCITGKWVCGQREFSVTFDSEESCLSAPSGYYKMYFHTSGEIMLGDHYSSSADIAVNTGNTMNYNLYGPFTHSLVVSNCEQISLGQVTSQTGEFSSNNPVTVQHSEGYYILKLKATDCPDNRISLAIFILNRDVECIENKADCQDCISSFSPEPGQYLVSAWTKGEVVNRNKSYENPGVSVSFVGASDSSYFAPSGKIIDDWQRIEGVVTVPPSATDIKIGLYCEDGDCYFDDIRFVPLDGGMVSYVYDPVTLRLVAELDERNYATFYEYDEEGKLIRVKKETERGIMTIQENRESLHKQ